MAISLGNLFNIDTSNIVLWTDYDADGDGYLSPSEYDAYIQAGGYDAPTIPRITEAELDDIEAGTSYSSSQLVDLFNNSAGAQDFDLSATYDPETNTFITDLSAFGFVGDAATRAYTPEEFMSQLGIEGGVFAPNADYELEESTAYTDWWGDDSTAWWDVEDPTAFFGVKGSRTEEQIERVQQFRDEFKYDLGGARPTLELLNNWINGDIDTAQFSQQLGEGYTPEATDPAIVGYGPTADDIAATYATAGIDPQREAELYAALQIREIMRTMAATGISVGDFVNPADFDLDGNGILNAEEQKAYDFQVAVAEGRIMTMYYTEGQANMGLAPVEGGTADFDQTAYEYWYEQLTQSDKDNLDAFGLIDDNNTPYPEMEELVQSIMDMFITYGGIKITPTSLDQIRNMNAGARQELREKRRFIQDLVNQGWTQEQARHIYYEWGGEGQELNPNKTMSDTEIADIYQLYQAGEVPEGQYPPTYAGDPSTITQPEIDYTRDQLLSKAGSPLAKRAIEKLTDDQVRDRIATERKNAAILAGINENGIYSPEFLENKRKLIKAGVDVAVAVTDPFEPEMMQNLRRLGYETAINKLNDFADSIATTRDENGGWVTLDPKAKNMLNLASFGLRAAGTTAQEMAGAITLIGETASDSILGRFGTAFVNLGASTETQDFSDAADEVEARLGRASGFFDSFKAIFQDGIPVEFLLRSVMPEVGNELILSRVFGGTTKGTKFKDADERFRDAILGGDRSIGSPNWLKEKLKTYAGIQPDELGDVAELVFATAGESFDRSYETAIKAINPETGELFTEEEAKDYAYEVMGRTVTGVFIVNRIGAGLSLDEMVENLFPGADNPAVREALRALMEHPVIKTAISAGGEAGIEGAEELVGTFLTTSALSLIDDSIDVAGESGQAAALGTLLGGLVDASMTAGFAIDSAAAKVIASRNPEINSVLTTARKELDAGTDLATVTRNMEEALNGLGLADVASQTDILDSVNDAAFTTGVETENKFKELGYTPTEEEINEYVGKNEETATLNTIGEYVDPRQVTLEEAKAELEAQGVQNPTDEEAAAYVGQGDENFEDVQTTAINEATLSRQEIKDAAALEGVTLSNAEADALAGMIEEGLTQEQAIRNQRDTFDPQAVSAAEIEDAAAKVGYTLAPGEAEALAVLVPEGKTEKEIIELQENVFNEQSITLAELEAIAEEEGYSLTPEDKELVGNVTEGTATSILDSKKDEFDDLVITEAELQAIATATGYDLTEEDLKLVGLVPEGESAGTILGNKETEFKTSVDQAAAAATRADYDTKIREFIKNNNIDLSEEEITARVDEAVAAGSLSTAIGNINAAQTVKNNRATLTAQFPELSPEEIDALMGQIADGDLIDDVIAGQITTQNRNTLEALFPELDETAIAGLMNQIAEGSNLDTVIAGQTNTQNTATLSAEFPDLSPEEIADLAQQVADGMDIDTVIQNQKDAEAAETSTGGAGTSTGGAGTSGATILEQVVAAALTLGIELTQEQIDKVVAEIGDNAEANIENG